MRKLRRYDTRSPRTPRKAFSVWVTLGSFWLPIWREALL